MNRRGLLKRIGTIALFTVGLRRRKTDEERLIEMVERGGEIRGGTFHINSPVVLHGTIDIEDCTFYVNQPLGHFGDDQLFQIGPDTMGRFCRNHIHYCG